MVMKLRSLIFLVLTALAIFTGSQNAGARVAPRPGFRQAEWPDTLAGRWAKDYFAAYNHDGKDALRRFIEDHYSEAYLRKTPIDDELGNHLLVRTVTGPLTVHSVDADCEYSIVATANTKNIGWVKFRIRLAVDAPHDLAELGPFATATPPAREGAKDYVDWKDLRDLAEKVLRDAQLPGLAVAVVRKGKIVKKIAIGVRRSDRSDPIRIDDRFHLGSVTKLITATMIGKLVESGALRWDSTIGEILDSLPVKKAYRSVTLEQLLQHRGGVPNLPTTGEFADGFPPVAGRSPAEARAALVRHVLLQDPVKMNEYVYSNAGYVVAGLMVERAVNKTWEELVSCLVFEPLEMHSAGFGWPATSDRRDQPMGHLGAPPDLEVQEIGAYTLGDMDYIGPAGNANCSIGDLARFASFLLQVLRGEQSDLEAGTVRRFWGCGEIENGNSLFNFFGSGGTFFTMMSICPENDLAIVVSTNCGLHAWPFFKKMRNAILTRPAQPTEVPLPKK